MPPIEVTDLEGLAIAEEHHGDPDVFSIGRNENGHLRFSGAVYFLSCAGVTCLAAVCFVALRCCCYRPDVYAAAKRNDDDNIESQETGCQDSATMTNPSMRSMPPCQPAPTSVASASAADQPKTSKSSPSTSRKEAACGSSAVPPPITTVTTVLDDGTERQRSISLREVKKPSRSVGNVKTVSGAGGGRSKQRRATVTGSPAPAIKAPLTSSTAASRPDAALVARNRRHVKPLRFRLKSVDIEPVSGGRPKLFRLLIVIVVWTSAVVGGPLSTVNVSYACYPDGSRSFVAGSVVADVVAALACVAAARATAGRGELSTVIAMTCLGTIILIYYAALVLFSLQLQQQQQQKEHETRTTEMPLFGGTAEMLTVSDDALDLARYDCIDRICYIKNYLCIYYLSNRFACCCPKKH